MKMPDPKPDWAAKELPEQGHEDLRRLIEFGGGPYDVEAGLATFEERIAQSGQATPRSLFLRLPRTAVAVLVLSGLAALAGFSAFRADAPSTDMPPVAVARATVTPAAARPIEVTSTKEVAIAATSIPSLNVDALPTIATAHPRPVPSPAATISKSTTVTSAPAAGIASPTDTADPIEAEVRHASKLRMVARTDPHGALPLAAEGDRLFPTGLLHAEREAIAIEALARLDRWTEAKARATAFEGAYPTHPRTARIRAISKGERPWEH